MSHFSTTSIHTNPLKTELSELRDGVTVSKQNSEYRPNGESVDITDYHFSFFSLEQKSNLKIPLHYRKGVTKKSGFVCRFFVVALN